MLLSLGVPIAREMMPADSPLANRSGTEVARELTGRLLLHYVTPANVGKYRNGRADPCYVTPTALSPEDTVAQLGLPAPNILRQYVLFLDPTRIGLIQGPQVVAFGKGIQYILPLGFPK